MVSTKDNYKGVIGVATKQRRTAFDVLGITRDEAMVNVLALYASATQDQIERGRVWYGIADDICINIALRFNKTREQSIGVMAACSPQAPWLGDETKKQCNTYRAIEVFTAQAQQRPVRKDGSCLSGREWDKAYQIAMGNYTDVHEWLGDKLKVPAFYASITERGLGTDVCCDTHVICLTANRLMGSKHPVVKALFAYNDRMADIQELITECAATVGELPQQMQAILWVTWKEKWGK
jgi:hypothetical protein